MVEVVVELWHLYYEEHEAGLVHHHHSVLEMVNNGHHQLYIMEFLTKQKYLTVYTLITALQANSIDMPIIMYQKSMK